MLQFRPDDVIRSAERIEEILRTRPPASATDAPGAQDEQGEGAGDHDIDGGRG